MKTLELKNSKLYLDGEEVTNMKHYSIYGTANGVAELNICMDKESHTMLCPEILSYASYMDKISAMGEDIASANYNQEPIDLKGQLYTSFKTYDDVPMDTTGKPLFSSVRNYTDTADEGSDYLCSITYGVYNKEAYILDVIYTQKPVVIDGDSLEIKEPIKRDDY